MKNLNKLFAAVLLVMGVSSHAQDSNHPWAVGFGVNAVDTKPGASPATFEGRFSEYFNVGKHWNILPSVSYLNVSRYIGSGFSAGVTGSVNKIEKMVQRDASGNYYVENPGDLTYYGIDLFGKYSFKDLINSKVIDPFVNLGGGYTWMGSTNAPTANVGLGLSIGLTESLALTLESRYKESFEGPSGLRDHYQHLAGLAFKFGGKDTDGDGVYDKNDECPEVPGLKEFNGCPDTDGDGVPDKDDTCPEVAGLKEFNGCPDTDGDGVPDNEDACPEAAGPKEHQGCPDSDGDGVPDNLDKCPHAKGTKENGGCPLSDRDGDGVADKDDKCPDVKGTVANHGCPEVDESVMKQLNDFSKTVLFDTGKHTIQKKSLDVVQSMAKIMEKYPTASFKINGYTDSTGSKTGNVKLSKERAAAVAKHLESKGISASRLKSEGYGPDSPIATNKTAAGRAQNRRVEVILEK